MFAGPMRGGCENLKASIALTIDVLFWFFLIFFVIKLFLVYLEAKASAARELKHLWKFTSGFIEPPILNFEISLSLSPGPKAVLFLLAKYIFEVMYVCSFYWKPFINFPIGYKYCSGSHLWFPVTLKQTLQGTIQ